LDILAKNFKNFRIPNIVDIVISKFKREILICLKVYKIYVSQKNAWEKLNLLVKKLIHADILVMVYVMNNNVLHVYMKIVAKIILD